MPQTFYLKDAYLPTDSERDQQAKSLQRARELEQQFRNSSEPVWIVGDKWTQGEGKKTTWYQGTLYDEAGFNSKFGNDPNVVGSKAYYDAQAASGVMKNIGTPEAPLYVSTGSAGDQLNQAVATNPNLTPEQQYQASLQGNNVNAPGIVPQAPNPPVQQPGQPTQQATQPGQLDATIGQNGQPPTQVGGTFGTQTFGRIGNDVYEIMADGSRRPVTEAEFNQKWKRLGLNLEVLPQLELTGGSGTPGTPSAGGLIPTDAPPATFAQEYANILQQLGITSIKDQFEEIQKEYKDLQDEKNEKIADVNMNPWLSEGARSKQIQSIQSKYEGKEDSLTARLELFESLYQEGLAQAKFLATGVQEDRLRMLEMTQKREEALAKIEQQEFENQLSLAGLNLDERKLALEQYKASKTGSGELTTAQINATINQIAGAFDNEPIVKEYNQILGQVNFIKTAGVTPTDDISRIYAFAKVMDPNSVVREGEYNTVQQYSQALLEQFGLKAKRVFDNSGFLTPEARGFIQDTLNRRLVTSQQQYKNLYNQYQQRIEQAKTGQYNSLPDYSTAFSNPQNEIEEDIRGLADSGMNREQIIEQLRIDYSEFNQNQIADKVYTILPDGYDRLKGNGTGPTSRSGAIKLAMNNDVVGGFTGGNLNSFKASIIQQESGNRGYGTVGEIPTKYGRALGKYQIIPQFWFSKIGLNPNSEKDKKTFLATPSLQDKLFGTIIEGLSKKYRNAFDKMAAAYYGGDAAVKKLWTKAGDVRPQKNAPSINEYVRQVLARIKGGGPDQYWFQRSTIKSTA